MIQFVEYFGKLLLDTIVKTIVTSVVVWLWEKIRKFPILNRIAAFFRISSKENCFVVMNHSAYDQNVITHGDDVKTLDEVVRLINEIGGKVVINDENKYAILAIFYSEHDSYPVILICGQTSKST